MKHPSARVLLIDDEPEVEEILRVSLRDESIDLQAVRDGAKGLAAAAQQKFDLLLLDLGLPDINGFEILKRIRANPQLSLLPIVVLTAWESVHDKVKGFELGATDYITKPFSVAELRARVRSILRSKSLQDQLTEANQSLQAADQAKSDFLAVISHEIRTPLNAVMAMTSILLEENLPPKPRDLVETIRNSGESLLAIINDILDFSKIAAGGLVLEMQPFDLLACLEDVTDLFAAKAIQKNLDFRSHYAPQLPAWVVGDALRLRQILSNLIDNAIKFTHSGEVCLEVKIIAEPLAGPAEPSPTPVATQDQRCQLAFSVRDTGIGIDPDKIDRLFKPFSQADTFTSRQYGGTGLGLAICQKLVKMMGGHITVQSVPGQGANFSFHLAMPVLPQPRLTSETHPPSRIDPGLAQRYPLSVLLVDDDIIGQKAVLQIFQQLGYHADVATNGAEALQSWERQHYDLLFLDLLMPELDGLETTRRIRQIEQNRSPTLTPQSHTIIIAMTAKAFPEDRAQCLAVGMNDYLAKPLRPREVQAMIEKWAPQIQKTAAAPAPPQPPQPPQPDNPPSIDLDRMIELTDGQPQHMKELFEIYLQQTESMIQEMKKNATTGSLSEIQHLAHKCAGSSGTCGMIKISHLFTGLETCARQGSALQIPDLLEQTATELQAIRKFLTSCFPSLPAAQIPPGAS